MTFWYGSVSESADPCLELMDPDPDSDPDPAIFVIDLQDDNTKYFFYKVFLLITLRENSKRSHKTLGNKVFLTIFA